MSKPYDVILVPFPLTNLVSQKIRPALQLSNITDNDVIFCAISTKKHSIFDLPVSPTNENGLKQVSYVRTNKIATIDKQLVLARLGTLETKTKESVQVKLRKIFGL